MNGTTLSREGSWPVAHTILGIALLAAISFSAEAQQSGQQAGSRSGGAGQQRGGRQGDRAARAQFDFTGMLAKQMLVQADRDGDSKLTQAEFLALANAWFEVFNRHFPDGC